jgi:hypothetical protein
MKNKTQQEHENMPIAAQNANEADTSEEKITDEMWQAIVRNDLPYDDKFFYGVKITGILLRNCGAYSKTGFGACCWSRYWRQSSFNCGALPSGYR